MLFTHHSVLAEDHRKHTITVLLENAIVLLHSPHLLQDQISEATSNIEKELSKKQFHHLKEFDDCISKLADRYGNGDLDLVAICMTDNIAFIKTRGKGKVYLNREDQYVLLLSQDNTASGRMDKNDFLIFSFEDVKSFWLDLGADFSKRLHRFLPHQITAMVPASTVASFHHPVIMARVDEAREVSKDVKTESIDNVSNAASQVPWGNLAQDNSAEPLWRRLIQTRALPIAMALVIIGILIWSVVLGVYRRADEKNNERIAAVKQSLKQKTAEAEDTAFINPSRALDLLSQMESELTALKTEMKDKHKDKQLAELDTLLNNAKKEITKQETKEASEFYDLSLDKKNASGDAFMLVDDQLYILDSNLSSIYVLSISKKSLTSFKQSIIAKADLITGNKDAIYINVPADGVYSVSEKSAKKVIPADKNMTKVSAIEMYNGNIYILNKGTDVLKFVAAGDGFGGGGSYFKSSVDLADISSLAIDSSIYLGGGEKILKYSAGLPDTFKTAFPVASVNVTKVLANKDAEQLYVWDKKNSSLYLLNKSGEYSGQIRSSVLAKASDVVVFDGRVYGLDGSKIYSFSIN